MNKLALQVLIKIKERDKVRTTQSQHLQSLDRNTGILPPPKFHFPGQPHARRIVFPCLQPQQLQFHQGTISWQRKVLEHWQFLTFPREKGTTWTEESVEPLVRVGQYCPRALPQFCHLMSPIRALEEEEKKRHLFNRLYWRTINNTEC